MLDIVSRQGAVKCRRCQRVTSLPAGVSVLDALPDYFGSDAPHRNTSVDDEATAGGATPVPCDECVEGRGHSVTVHCLQCQAAALCEMHVRADAQDRGTAKHDVEKISGDKTSLRADQKASPVCSLHTSYKLTKFCLTCRELLCERCEQLGSHRNESATCDGEGGHNVVDVDTVGEQEPAKLRKALLSSNIEEHSAAKQARLCLVKEKMFEVKATSEREAAKVKEATDRLVKLLRAEERFVLVGEIRWKRLKALEKLEARDSDALEVAERCRHLMTEAVENLGSSQLLQVGDALSEALGRTMVGLSEGTMSVPRSVMLFESRESVIEDAIRQGLGNVVCVKVDPSKRTAQRFQQSVRPKELVTFKDENRVCPSAQSVDVVTQTVSEYVCALPEFDHSDSSSVVRPNLATSDSAC